MYVANAREQLQELIRQQYNHASVATWAVGNETSARQLQCDEPYDNVTPVIRTLHETAKTEDPSRPTAYAEFDENIGKPLPFATAGITDILGTNRYYWWYDLAVEEFEPLLAAMHGRYPNQPVGLSEYGAGAALTHHTDDPTGGPPEVRSADEGDVTYQPEEYAAYVHEQVYRVISRTPFLWGGFVWNMFDFGSAHRNEGDVLGVNTKGLVTFDRMTRKDPFYFYKANWSAEPLTYILGRRYAERAYPVADVQVYSNADSVELVVNGAPFAVLTSDRCEQKTCMFEDVPLAQGANAVEARGTHAGGATSTDSVQWNLATTGVNIAAGRLTTGYMSSRGLRFGSDEFFVGGTAEPLDPGDVKGGTPSVDATSDPLLYKFFRRGTFRYEIPVPDGNYTVTLGFVEPNTDAAGGANVFDVSANGAVVLDDVDVARDAGDERTALERSFQVTVQGGTLTLAFVPVRGDALVSNISVAGP
jgi:beta-galactosidase